MRVSYQRGHLRYVKRKDGPPRWEFLWRENDLSGNRIRRNAVIGTLEQYPTEELAQAVVNGLRMHINDVRNRQPEQPILLGDLIDHYRSTEWAADSDGVLMLHRLSIENFSPDGSNRIGATWIFARFEL